MKIILDTNLWLVSISRRSETHLIFESLLEGFYELCVSTGMERSQVDTAR